MSTRRILLSLVSLFASLAMMAQNVNVTVKLTDASNDEPIGFATVSLTPEKGSAKYSLTDNNGKGTIEKVKVGKYTFKAEIMGYKSYEKAVEITKEATDLGVVKMELDQRVLDAASVTATGNPIIIKKDTVEYNASSFKTTDTDIRASRSMTTVPSPRTARPSRRSPSTARPSSWTIPSSLPRTFPRR